MRIDVWYPASFTAREAALTYHMGSRGLAAQEAPPVDQRLALVVLSAGDFRPATAYSWVGEALARQGFIVAGTACRPRDCSAALDAVLADPHFEPVADPGRVGAIGHSAGGAAVIALAGAFFDPEAMDQYCRSEEARGDLACSLGGGGDRLPGAEDGATRQDDRVRAVVAMDPAYGPGHDAHSLARVKIPVLIIGSVNNDFLPFAHHAGRYARLIPGASLTPLAHGEGHFIFMDECSADLAVQGVLVCKDRGGVRRSVVHSRLVEKIGSFFEEHLAPS